MTELDTWDAACLAWAHLDETARATPETLNPEGAQKLREMLLPSEATENAGGVQTTTNDSAADVDELRALMQRPKEVHTVTT